MTIRTIIGDQTRNNDRLIALATPTHAYLIIADGDLDQVCETREDARREANDLRMMGCDIVVHKCLWDDQNAVITLNGSHA